VVRAGPGVREAAPELAGGRVYVFGDAGELVSLPAEWTDLAPADPFVVVAAGRAPFGRRIC
jgi:Family of unknown function (DUF5372)